MGEHLPDSRSLPVSQVTFLPMVWYIPTIYIEQRYLIESLKLLLPFLLLRPLSVTYCNKVHFLFCRKKYSDKYNGVLPVPQYWAAKNQSLGFRFSWNTLIFNTKTKDNVGFGNKHSQLLWKNLRRRINLTANKDFDTVLNLELTCCV